MTALDKKAVRDLLAMKGPGLAIALVMAAGVSMYIMMLSTFDSLQLTQALYYRQNRFADVFANAKRAPRGLETAIADIPGVQQVATRVVAEVTLDLPALTEPAAGRLISVPEPREGGRAAALNDVTLMSGRYVEPDRPDEVLVNEGFADAHALAPGDRVTAVINGRRRQLDVVGIALSPEYIYAVRPGEMLPDQKRFGVFWMNREALANAFDMEGSFNDVALRLAPGTSSDQVIARLDLLLEPYGGLGAVSRSLQLSHWWLEDQLTQLQEMGRVVPIIFLAVGAGLLSVVLNRIVAVQRGQIAALKALGYSNYELGRHYALWGLAISAVGAVLGIGFGAWLGKLMMELQNDFFNFPFLVYRVKASVVLGAVGFSLVAAVAGATGAVRRAVRLPPAEAMRPEPPGDFRPSLVERAGLAPLLSQAGRMVLRNIERRPVRALASVGGTACGVAILIVGMFALDGFDEMLEVQFGLAQLQDVTVTFVEPRSAGAFYELQRLPGVRYVEPMRSVPVRLVSGHRSRQLTITGLPAAARLQRVIDRSLDPVALPPEGLVLSKTLAERLGVAAGDEVTVEVLTGERPVRRLQVSSLVDEYVGLSSYMQIDALHRLMGEGRSLSGAYLSIDRGADTAGRDGAAELYRRLKALPAVAGVAVKAATIENFDRTIKESMAVSIFFNVLFAAIIAAGVVYNTARVSLSERSRELASLRVLGFTRGEISAILLGELAVVTLVAIPVGFVLGYALSALTVTAFATEVYRVPLLVTPRVYALSALTVLAAATLSGLAVRRRLDHLDLIEVLKTRE